MKANQVQELLEDVLNTFDAEAEVLIAGVYEILSVIMNTATGCRILFLLPVLILARFFRCFAVVFLQLL